MKENLDPLQRTSLLESQHGQLPEDVEGLPRVRHGGPWRGCRLVVFIIAAVCVSFSILSIAASQVQKWTGTSSLPQSPLTEDHHSVVSEDYILDPNWNFQAPPQKREYTFTIRDQEHNPDGVYRPMILVNNQFPGPLIEVNVDDTVVVHVHNRAVNATSIHWHGIYQNGTNHMDGTVGVTQCPIAPGGNFTYEFKVTGQSGTYWWHAHQSAQAADGVHGPLVIHARDEGRLPHNEYATDRVIMVGDHYHDLSSALMWQYLKPDAENTEPAPIGGLINGRSIRSCDDFPDRKCDNTSSHVGHPIFDLTPGKSHQLRLINVGIFAEFQIQIDEHELFVCEVDGTNVHPKGYHRININPAQRYSVVIQPRSDTYKSFWLRARMITHCFTDPSPSLDSDVRAIVRYESSASAPISTDWTDNLELECRDLNTTELEPVQVVTAPHEVDAFYYVRSNFEIGAHRLSRGFFNSSSWRPNIRSPSLLRVVDGLAEKNESFSLTSSRKSAVNDQAFNIDQELVIQTSGIQTIDVMISNFDDGNHPMHLHGYKYFVLAQGLGYPPMLEPGEMSLQNLQPLYKSLNLTNPLRRDTASVEAFGWMLIRIVADNPGVWAFHCHVGWHAEAGLLMQFLTRTEGLSTVPETNRALCHADGLEKGMGPDDKVYAELDGG